MFYTYLFTLAKNKGKACHFLIFFRPIRNLLGAPPPPICYYFESVEHGTIFILVKHSLGLTEALLFEL